jgi:hypothetical protein
MAKAELSPNARQRALLADSGVVHEPDLDGPVLGGRGQGRGHETGEPRSENRLRLGVAPGMLRTHRQAPEGEPGQQLAHRALVQADPELARDPVPQVPAAPAHDAVAPEVRPLLGPPGHDRFLPGRQARPRAVAPRQVGQAREPFGGVAMRPVAQGLPVHAATLGRVLARPPFQDERDRQHPPRRLGVPRPGRLAPQIARRQVSPRDRYRHVRLRSKLMQERITTAAKAASRPSQRSGRLV